MIRKTNKVLSIFFSLVLVLGLLPATALAARNSDAGRWSSFGLAAGANASVLPDPAKADFVIFLSDGPFTIATANGAKNWNGSLYYSVDAKRWTEWNGAAAIESGANNALYLHGTRNTEITGLAGENASWQIQAESGVACFGNIETLLDYKEVNRGGHPKMGANCYRSLFENCAVLTTAPALPAVVLADSCYRSMFSGCAALTEAPELPATTLADSCYFSMFSGCEALTAAPALPAAALTDWCYYEMFNGCTALVAAPELSAPALAKNSYNAMFSGCEALTAAPALPAMVLANGCYRNMFAGCTALVSAPALPAMVLENDCYSGMFARCTALTEAPELPAMLLAYYCYANMFSGCEALASAPALPATTLATGCYSGMFAGCTALTAPTELPAMLLVNACYRSMFSGCVNIKLSDERSNDYTTQYRIPTLGNGTTAEDALTDMFAGTGGEFAGTPEINTLYYLHSSGSIVR